MNKWKLAIPVLALFLCSCELDNDERCKDGQVFDSLSGVCRTKSALTDTGSNTDTTLPDTDTNTQQLDSNATDTTDTATLSGSPQEDLPCWSDADCTGNAPLDYCLANGMDTSQPGLCVQDNCSPGDCISTQQCCDCSAVPIFGWPSPLCWPNEYVTGDYGVETYGCTCQ